MYILNNLTEKKTKYNNNNSKSLISLFSYIGVVEQTVDTYLLALKIAMQQRVTIAIMRNGMLTRKITLKWLLG